MILNTLKIKLPFVILLFLTSCINVGVEKYENKTISQKSSDCNLIINQESKKSLNTIVCQDGYKFEIPKFTYDEKSCRVEPYTPKSEYFQIALSQYLSWAFHHLPVRILLYRHFLVYFVRKG